ncbi:MAG: hypothetical protein ACM3S4_10025 [Burkholderiales bacterium]
MMLRLIDDVNKALDAECYFSALALALTFPDICGKAEYPEEKMTSQRYKAWYDKYIGKYEQCPCEKCREIKMPYLSGEVVYSLRNSLLHQGTPNIDVDKIQDNNNKIDSFELILESKKPFDIYHDAAEIYNERTKRYRVNVRRLCIILCRSTRAYYETNRDKFNFFRYSIIDWDSEVNKMRDLGF